MPISISYVFQCLGCASRGRFCYRNVLTCAQSNSFSDTYHNQVLGSRAFSASLVSNEFAKGNHLGAGTEVSAEPTRGTDLGLYNDKKKTHGYSHLI